MNEIADSLRQIAKKIESLEGDAVKYRCGEIRVEVPYHLLPSSYSDINSFVVRFEMAPTDVEVTQDMFSRPRAFVSGKLRATSC